MKPLKELGKPIATKAQLDRVRFSPCGKVLVAGGSDSMIYRWDASGKDLTELPAMKNHDGWITNLVFQPTTKKLISTDSWGRINAWDVLDKDEKKLWSIDTAHDGWIRSALIANDTLVTSGRDQSIRWWSMEGKKLRELKTDFDPMSLAASADGKTIVAGDPFGRIHTITDRTSMTVELKDFHLLDRIQDVGGIRCLKFTPDGKSLIVAGAQPKTGGFVQAFPLIAMVDWPSGKKAHQWLCASEKEGYIHDLDWHADGWVVAVSSGQPGSGKVLCWKPGDAEPFYQYTKLANCHSLDRQPTTGRWIASGTNANSSGNGRPKGAEYPGNHSPLQWFE